MQALIASYVSLSRDVLNSMPYAALLALVTVGSVLAAMLTLYVVRRFVGQWRSSADAPVIGGVAAMVLTLFALLLAFGIVTLYDERRAAQSAVAQEAADLAVVKRDAEALEQLGVTLKRPTPKLRGAIEAYVCWVQEHEFAAMQNGEPVGTIPLERNAQDADRYVTPQLSNVFRALANYTLTSRAQAAFYESAVVQLSDAVAQRRARLQRVDNALPFAFAVLLILTSAMSVILTCFIKTTGLSKQGEPHAGIEYVLVGSVAFVVAAGLLTALIFEFPFSGPLAISDQPFRSVNGC